MIKYCTATHKTERWKTRQVMIGSVSVGSNNPIRIQSMTTSNTRDVEATIDQIIRLSDCGCEIARITVQGMKEAEACEHIKNGLIRKGYTIPLVADIHFFPPAALKVVEFVEKVRVNPGNFVDRRATFKVIEYDDISYAKELEKIEEKLTPLILKCKQLKRAMRIGTNHGSLSDRIMNRYGDTPAGMVESALEFARVCRKNNFHDIIFSMKASNPRVMIQAYRLLVASMIELGWDYPLHLGVTEAGEGEDGRVKSAMGIGSLLLDGLGDTIRVSLTEDPWYEIDPCQRLVALAERYQGQGIAPFEEHHRHIDALKRRHVHFPKTMALHRDGSVLVTIKPDDLTDGLSDKIGCKLDESIFKPSISSADGVVLYSDLKEEQKDYLTMLIKGGIGVFSTIPLKGSYALSDLSLTNKKSELTERFALPMIKEKVPSALVISDTAPADWQTIANVKPELIILSPKENRLHFCRHFFEGMQQHGIDIPVILNFSYSCSLEDFVIQAAAECGALLSDGLGEGLWLEGPYDIEYIRQLSFNILQAARMRTTKTDFISCPSCGRTLFDLQDVTRRIRTRTSHLPGVKIAIMGCIVNGPGEMADADFGYVGSKPGMIDLYVGKNCVEKDISFADADDRLIELIKKHGRWVEQAEISTSQLSQSFK